jgi:hypothetical protein
MDNVVQIWAHFAELFGIRADRLPTDGCIYTGGSCMIAVFGLVLACWEGVPGTSFEEGQGISGCRWQFQAARAHVCAKACSCFAVGVSATGAAGRQKVEEMLVWCDANPESLELRSYATLFLFSYCFLLRGPSEALPAVASGHGHEACTDAALNIEKDSLVLALKRRKNKPEGSRLVRKCSCRQSAISCVYCRFKPMLETARPGQPMFPGLTPAGTLRTFGHLVQYALQICDRCCCSVEGFAGSSWH